MKRLGSLASLAAGAAAVTVALTGTAFWLSFEHLHDVAAANGLTGARAWAWPGTVDMFIIAGELLILRAALLRRVDWFAYLLTAVGSIGSIALNVAGVGADAQLMEYIVAAVPPSAALIAFGALMRQVHEHLVPRAVPAVVAVPPRPVEEPVILERTEQQDAVGTPELPPVPPQDTEDNDTSWPALLTSRDVAEKCGVDPSTVRSWVANGRLPVHSKDARGHNLFQPAALLEAVTR
ncbi:DUF2637 domain-containing protein [Streptomyces sp. NPDC060064]|uniref:DUF2637 domain-containing protein n=1 Tax=Streptomyces sp. NPDC060064 TaxID=3347049 RepID=UPI00369755C4